MTGLKFFSRLFVSAFAAVAFAAAASAQSNVLVVDTGRVVTESEVGKHIKRQVEAIGKTMNSELEASLAPITSKEQSLNAEFGQMDQKAALEKLNARPDLKQRLGEVTQGKQRLAQEGQIKQVELKRTEDKALAQVEAKTMEIITRLAKERGADVVLERKLVLYGDPVDVTDIVISRLNAEMSRVSVTRERLPRQAPTQTGG